MDKLNNFLLSSKVGLVLVIAFIALGILEIHSLGQTRQDNAIEQVIATEPQYEDITHLYEKKCIGRYLYWVKKSASKYDTPFPAYYAGDEFVDYAKSKHQSQTANPRLEICG